MSPSDLLVDGLGRTAENVGSLLADVTDDELIARPTPEGNSIAWLVWHLTRVQDDHVADVAGAEQVWTGQGYADRFGLPLDVADHGYGHSGEQVGLVRAPVDLLADYHRATHAASVTYLAGLSAHDLDRVVDERWDPPVTLGVRLVSVVDDCAQHAGQAAYLLGLLRGGLSPA